MQAVQISQRQSCASCRLKVALLVKSDGESRSSVMLNASAEVGEMQRVLQHPELGGFDRVQLLLNPDLATLQREIEILFGSIYQSDDLILLYFSGYLTWDDRGNLNFALGDKAFGDSSVREAELTSSQRSSDLSNLPIRWIRDCMGLSHSTRQVTILDCQMAEGGGDPGLVTSDPSDISAQLGDRQRLVLSAIAPANSSVDASKFQEAKIQERRSYTRYLIEGIETGEADRDGDGMIAIDELHEYAGERAQQASPSLQLEISGNWEEDKICLAKVPVADPKLEYRREVDRLARQKQGKISTIVRTALNIRYQELGLHPAIATQIEMEVLESYRESKSALQQYEEALLTALALHPLLSQEDHEDLRYLQQVLKLYDEEVAPVLTKAGVIVALEAAVQPDSISLDSDLGDDLSSARGMDYTRLRDLLIESNWEAADHETQLLMLEMVGRSQGDWIRKEEIVDFSCIDLQVIDRLWLKYSQGRYGFSAQKQIWFSMGDDPERCDRETWAAFGARLGWCVEQSWVYHDCLNFSLNAPEGHLPSGSWGGAFSCMMLCLFDRLEDCNKLGDTLELPHL
jgi:hypothetical protein